MTLAPQLLINLWAGLRASRMVRRQSAAGRVGAAQQRILRERLAAAAGTEVGRSLDLHADMPYDQFRERVPLRHPDWFEPFVQRMLQGEANVLVPGRCALFARSAGATGETPKLLPVPDAMLAHFRDGLRDALFHYVHRVGHAGVILGRHLQVGASTALQPAGDAHIATLDGLVAHALSPWAVANLRAPAPEIAAMPEGAEKIEALARSELKRNVTLVGGTAAWLCALSVAAREAASVGKQRVTHLQAIWPKLECCLYTGAPLGQFAAALRAGLGPTVHFHEVYLACEGVLAAQDDGRPTALRVLADAGVFFEFLPCAVYNETTLARAGGQCVPLERVSTGVNYLPVITTPAGLTRYILGDVVRFVSVEPPRLQFIGRLALQLNAFGERATETDVLESLQAVCTRNGWQPIAVHVAPYEQRLGPGRFANVHEWWLELHTHTVKTPTANILGPELDAEMMQRCPEYAVRRRNGAMGAPLIRLVMPGVFESWARQHQHTAFASKLARCRPDRLVADQLAAIAPFHQASIVPDPR